MLPTVYKLPKDSSILVPYENVTNLFDGKYDTKYFTYSPCFNDSPTNNDDNVECGIIKKFDNPFLLNKMTLTAANDLENRDPKSIQILVRIQTENVYKIKDWSLLYTNNLKLSSDRQTPNIFSDMGITISTIVQFVISEVKGPIMAYELGWQHPKSSSSSNQCVNRALIWFTCDELSTIQANQGQMWN